MVLTVLLDWSHDRFPVYSVSLHPDSTMAATGGGDHKVKIWRVPKPTDFREETQLMSEQEPLATLSGHTSSVNSVRFSPTGCYLASASDDHSIKIWEIAGYKQGQTLKQENCKLRWTLLGHTGDVSDIVWAPDGKILYSCSVDNTVKVWEIPQPSARDNYKLKQSLEDEKAIIKGMTIDPWNKYLATQDDSDGMYIWRLGDVVKKEFSLVGKPFKTTAAVYFKRPSWAPDGSVIVGAAGNKQGKNCAPIIKRSEWTYDREFIGHAKPVVCARWNPQIFRSSEESYLICALGSQDGTISLWRTDSATASCVVKNAVLQSITDMSWNTNGNILIASSCDGIRACFFSKEETGEGIPKEEVLELLKKVYGSNFSGGSDTNDIDESPATKVLEDRYRDIQQKKKKTKELIEKKTKKQTKAAEKNEKKKEKEKAKEKEKEKQKAKEEAEKDSDNAGENFDEEELTQSFDESENAVLTQSAFPQQQQQSPTTMPTGLTSSTVTDKVKKKEIVDQSTATTSQTIVTPTGVVTQQIIVNNGKKRVIPTSVSGGPFPSTVTTTNTMTTTTTTTATTSTKTTPTSTPSKFQAALELETSAEKENKKKRKRSVEKEEDESKRAKKPKLSGSSSSFLTSSDSQSSLPSPLLSSSVIPTTPKRAQEVAPVFTFRTRSHYNNNNNNNNTGTTNTSNPPNTSNTPSSSNSSNKSTKANEPVNTDTSNNNTVNNTNVPNGNITGYYYFEVPKVYDKFSKEIIVNLPVPGSFTTSTIPLNTATTTSTTTTTTTTSTTTTTNTNTSTDKSTYLKTALIEALWDPKLKISTISCVANGQERWKDKINAQVTAVCGSKSYVGIGTYGGELYIYSLYGRLLFPGIILGSPVVFLAVEKSALGSSGNSASNFFRGKYMLAVTCTGACHLFNMENYSTLVTSLAQIADHIGDANIKIDLSESGFILVFSVTSGELFAFSPDTQLWHRVIDRRHTHSDYFPLLPDFCSDASFIQSSSQLFVKKHKDIIPNKSGPEFLENLHPVLDVHILASTASLKSTPISISSGSRDKSSESIAHLESTLASCVLFKSPVEYIEYAELYVNRLSTEGLSDKLRDFFEFLMGPFYHPDDDDNNNDNDDSDDSNNNNNGSINVVGHWTSGTKWRPTILGIKKRKLLDRLLPITSVNKSLQNLSLHYTKGLEFLKTNSITNSNNNSNNNSKNNNDSMTC